MTENFADAEAPGLPVSPVDPHAADLNEDPERHIGAPMNDPWDDPGQTDWADHTVDLDPRTMGV